jgi:four helix bundle protein
MAKSVDELKVYQNALAASAEVSNHIRKRRFDNDVRLRSQLGASSESAASLISEGFEQSSDRYFAQYCYRAKGSCAEMRTQLRVARDRALISEDERKRLDDMYDQISRMLAGLIDHLEREDRKSRRRGR